MQQLGPLRLFVPDPTTLSLPSLVIALAAGYALLRRRVGMLPVLGASAAAGALFRLAT
jgi:chromate transporter